MSVQLTLLRPTNGRPPSFKRTLGALGIIPDLLYQALEFGASQNRLFFEQLSQGERPRPHIREMIVRDQAKRFLERNNFQVEDESLSVGSEPLSALIVRCGPAQLRVLKAVGGATPGCGESGRRKRFYGQVSEPYLGADGKVRQTRLNLLFLWDFDGIFNLGDVWLACPMRGGETSADVLIHWHEPIPHPATTIVATKLDDVNRQAEDELEKLLTDEQATEAEEQA